MKAIRNYSKGYIRKMNKIIRSVVFILIAGFVTNCSMTYKMPVFLKENFTFQYTPEKKNLNSLININGYYTQIEINHRKIYKGFYGKTYETVIDTFYMNYLFFNDGIMIENMFSSKLTSDTVDMPKHLTKMAIDTTKSMKLLGVWGTYIISGDTIKTQTIRPSGSLNDGWSSWEKYFKVINRTTIKLIYKKPLHYLSPSDKKVYTEHYYQERIKDEIPAKFIPSKAIPSSDCWLKEEMWFWKDENNYLEYKDKRSGL